MELQAYFGPVRAGQPVQSVPGGGLGVPIWLLGSSLFSAQLAAALGLPFAAARRLFTSLQQSFVNLRRGAPGPLPPPVDSMDGRWSPPEEQGVAHAFGEAIVGSPARVRKGIEAFVARTGVDELMVTAAIFDQAARLRSFEIVAEVMGLVSLAVAGR